MEAAADPILDGHSQVGSPLSLRLEVGGIHDVGRETSLGIALEEVELPRERELDLVRKRTPVLGPEGAGALDDLAEGLRRHVAAEVDAVVAEAAHDGEVLRREIDEERAPLVRAGAVSLGQRQQLVGHDDAGDDPAVEGTRGRAREQVDVRENAQVETVATDPANELVVLARVPAGLVDDETGARPHLLAELEVLRHHLALVALVVRDDSAQEEVRPLERRLRPARVR